MQNSEEKYYAGSTIAYLFDRKKYPKEIELELTDHIMYFTDSMDVGYEANRDYISENLYKLKVLATAVNRDGLKKLILGLINKLKGDVKQMEKELVKVGKGEITAKEFRGTRVVTAWDIARLHGREVLRVNEQFKNNKKRFVEGEDYFEITKEEFVIDINDNGIKQQSLAPLKSVKLFTESGYLMLVKTFNDDLSWDIQRQLVKTYFKAKDIVADAEQLATTVIEKFLDKLEIADPKNPRTEGLMAEMLSRISVLEKQLGVTKEIMNKKLEQKIEDQIEELRQRWKYYNNLTLLDKNRTECKKYYFKCAIKEIARRKKKAISYNEIYTEIENFTGKNYHEKAQTEKKSILDCIAYDGQIDNLVMIAERILKEDMREELEKEPLKLI